MLLVSHAAKMQITACACIYRNKAIADYLSANGYTNTLAEFQKETNMVCCLCFFCHYLKCVIYKGHSINKLHNGVVPLILKM